MPGASSVPDYFDELLERIRDIRASERRMYLRVRDIFMLAADYQPSDKETSRFFSVIQNKLHFAATGQTAAEIIHSRADASLPNMGLTVWKREIVRKNDVTIAKNYLHEDEIDDQQRVDKRGGFWGRPRHAPKDAGDEEATNDQNPLRLRLQTRHPEEVLQHKPVD